MDYNKAKEELKPHLKSYVESITQKSKGQNMYICPLCGSGTGKSKTGAFSIKDATRWKCFSCGKSGDIFDLIGEVEHIEEPLNQLRRAVELFKVDIDGAENQNQHKSKRGTDMNIHTNTYTHTDTDKKESLVPYYKECQARLKETDYHTSRGISVEVATRFMLGYEPNYTTGTGGKPWKALIIPTGKYSYVARNTDPEADNSDRYRKTGNTPFNVKALQTAKKPIFITEGEIDALSIIEVGGEAIGLGSAVNVNSFIENFIKKQKPVQPLVIALDNDKKGQEATEKLEEALDKLEVPYYRLDPYNGSKDANQALLEDREAFTKAVAQAEHLEEEALETEREEYYKTSSYNHLQEFIDGIAESANTPAQPTGYEKLDKVLDGGLYEGLYILGAITSLGKTTLALQIVDQIAKSGRDVLIFSLEMARAELMSKSISRETLLDVMADPAGDIKEAKTNRGITAGARYANYSTKEKELIKRAVEAYGKYASHIFIHEGIGNIGTEQIRETVQKHIKFTGQAPVVLVDYIQILAPNDVRATDKQNTDKAVLELKRISRDYKIPVIGISSFNRASYKEAVTLEAFKESGSVEYGSDVLIGLQLQGAGKKDFDSNEAKKKDPRSIELVILKNRNGRTGDKIAYSYYPLFNYFEEV